MRKLLKKTGRAMVLALGLSALLGLAAHAESPTLYADPTALKDGTISFTMVYKYTQNGEAKERIVGGGNLVMYKVADIVTAESGGYAYKWVPQIEALIGKENTEGSGNFTLDLSKIGTAALAAEVDDAITVAKLSPDAKHKDPVSISSDGKAKFSGVDIGMYAFRQTVAAKGYELLSPFMVTLPMYQEPDAAGNAGYFFDVDASPKPQLVGKSSPRSGGGNPPEPNTPPGPDTPPGPGTPPGDGDTPPDEGVLGASRNGGGDTPEQAVLGASRLPQTGQLKWPVAVMTVLGIIFLFGGFTLRRSEERNR